MIMKTRTLFLVLALCLTFSMPVYAQDDVPPRPTIRLDGAAAGQIDGNLAGYCWLQAQGDLTCDVDFGVQPPAPLEVPTGQALTILIEGGDGAPDELTVSVDGGIPEPLTPQIQAIYDNLLAPGEHVLEVLATYTIGTSNAYVSYLFSLTVFDPTAEVAMAQTEESDEADSMMATDEAEESDEADSMMATDEAEESDEADSMMATEEADEADEADSIIATEEADEDATEAPTTPPSATPIPSPTPTDVQSEDQNADQADEQMATDATDDDAEISDEDASETTAGSDLGEGGSVPLATATTVELAQQQPQQSQQSDPTATTVALAQPSDDSAASDEDSEMGDASQTDENVGTGGQADEQMPTLRPTSTTVPFNPQPSGGQEVAQVASPTLAPSPTLMPTQTQVSPIAEPDAPPMVNLVFAGRTYSAAGVSFCQTQPNGQQICVDSPLPRSGESTRLLEGFPAQIQLMDSPPPSEIELTFLDANTLQEAQAVIVPGDVIVLFNIDVAPNIYILQISVDWQTVTADYFFRVRVD